MLARGDAVSRPATLDGPRNDTLEDHPLTVEERLKAAGIELPPPIQVPGAAPANLVPARRVGDLVYLSGQGPIIDGDVRYRGKVGSDLSVEDGYAAARLTGINLIAALQREIGDLERVVQWVKVLGMVNSAPDFDQQPAVINGFSDLIVELFGQERGMHARSAVGVPVLPGPQLLLAGAAGRTRSVCASARP